VGVCCNQQKSLDEEQGVRPSELEIGESSPLPRVPLLHLHPAHSPSGSGFGKLHPRSAAPPHPHRALAPVPLYAHLLP
jgi:hypothetical protein